MNVLGATHFLRDQQKKIRGLFRQSMVLGQRAPEMRDSVIREALVEFELYRVSEERIFLPALERASDGEARNLAGQCRESLRELHDAVTACVEAGPDAESFSEVLADLRKSAELYFEKELRDIFPLADRLLTSESEALGRRLQETRIRLLKSAPFAPARAETAQNPHGGEQKRKVG